uniref:THAP domain containing 7 n=1 Tax=Chelonoidis abingdonii TaxID=106734 RepID=A0A8C0GWY9_CHEAB
MPRHCSATGCCTRDTRETRNRGISFHRLPKKDNPRRSMWLENCQRKDPSGQGPWNPVSDYIYFCSKHFEKSCFEMVGISGYHRLKEGAVPTVFESFSKARRAAKMRGLGCAKAEHMEQGVCRLGCGSEGPGRGEQDAPANAEISCFPEEEESELATPAAAPTTEHRSLPGPLSDILLEYPAVATGQEATDAPSEAPASPAPEPPRPVSPSFYMLRLPPPAGAYIQSEHSYQVGSALLWKRRAEAALEALDRVQRQLQACKRREQRLRLRICELQRERRAAPDMRRQLKEHLQVFELQLLRDLE